MINVERWGRFETALQGPAGGNPYVDVVVKAVFTHENRSVPAEGFYDGEGVYKVRFMPDEEGTWSYRVDSSSTEMTTVDGEFRCVEPAVDNHGPVRISEKTHFRYADGTPYYPFGTTCYVWTHQGDELETQTLETLASSPFNKLRMCVYPKHYDFNDNEPEMYPFEGEPLTNWNYSRFNPLFFRHLEDRIEDLLDLGIEADLILFHPYDRWDFSRMDKGTDERYLRYIVARLSSYRNVWWCFANEFDLMREKDESDWDGFFKLVQRKDPAQHLRSIHNCKVVYDHNKPWVTHCSMSFDDLTKVTQWIGDYGKPVVVDECNYEGNIMLDWGNITPEEMVNRFWEGFSRGGYVGHGETYVHPDDILWWSKGGVLHGESPERISFLRGIVESSLRIGAIPHRWNYAVGGIPGRFYIYYSGDRQPIFRLYKLPDDTQFKAEIIDAWNMTITPVEGTFSGMTRLDLPGRRYIAVRFTAIE